MSPHTHTHAHTRTCTYTHVYMCTVGFRVGGSGPLWMSSAEPLGADPVAVQWPLWPREVGPGLVQADAQAHG